MFLFFRVPEENLPIYPYRISSYYYTLVGAIITALIAIPVSLKTGGRKQVVDRDLLSPVIYRFISDEHVSSIDKKRQEQIDLKSVNAKEQNKISNCKVFNINNDVPIITEKFTSINSEVININNDVTDINNEVMNINKVPNKNNNGTNIKNEIKNSINETTNNNEVMINEDMNINNEINSEVMKHVSNTNNEATN